MTDYTLAIAGGGPRGISLLERIGAHVSQAGDQQRYTIHIIDPYEVGSGAVWRTNQTRTLCMNTLAHGVTLFTEPGASVTGPIWPGPTMYEWAQLLRGDTHLVPKEHRLPVDSAVLEEYRDEITAMAEHSHPTRALYGEYLLWVYDITKQRLPEQITVVEHIARVDAISADGERDILHLSDGTTITADATALALGWITPAPSPAEQALIDAPGLYIAPESPINQDFSSVPDGGRVLMRGLGMSFYDALALLTLDRGGRFIHDPYTRGGLRYDASGREPHVVVASGRGWPYLAKPQYGSMPPAAHMPRSRRVFRELAGAESINYDEQVWPAILRDSYEAYYLTYGLGAELVRATVDAHSTIESLTQAFDVPEEDRFDLAREANPLAGFTGTTEELTEFTARGVAADLRDSELGTRSPRKMALTVISAARKPSSLLGTPGRITDRDGMIRFVKNLGQMAGSGPPAFRNQELLALIDAGLVTFLGARPTVRITDSGFAMSSPSTENEQVEAPTLIDAFVNSPDTRHPGEPVVAALRAAGRSRPYHYPDGETSTSPEIHQATGQLIRADGVPDPRLFALGIPLSAVRADTTISPLPGTDATMLQETDLVARSMLATMSR